MATKKRHLSLASSIKKPKVNKSAQSIHDVAAGKIQMMTGKTPVKKRTK